MRKIMIIAVLLWGGLVHAEITTDGSVGPLLNLPGPDYRIDAELGRQHGGNLFHSFEAFNIRQDESAAFSGPDSVNNVISRVTGGNPSEINGVLRSEISQADLYLINPAGLLFGPEARLDVQGSFHAGTADTIRFADDAEFNARHPRMSAFSTANPAAFGFLSNAPAALKIENSQLTVPEAKTFSLAGGSLQINLAELNAPAGRLNLAGAGGAGEVVLPFEKGGISGKISTSVPLGDISVQDSVLSTSGEGGGAIYIRGGRFELHNSTLAADTLGTEDGHGLDVRTESFIAADSRVSASTFGPGKGGGVRIQAAGLVEISASESEGVNIGVFARAGSFEERNKATGDGGNFILKAGELHLRDGAGISASTYGSGQSGDITVQADGTVRLSGENKKGSSSYIAAATTGETELAGKGGNIKLTTEELFLSGGAGINANTYGPGEGGKIIIQAAKSVRLEGESSQNRSSRISAQTQGKTEPAGKGGNIELATEELLLDGGAFISTITFGLGEGGNIMVQAAKTVRMKGESSQGYVTFITAATVGGMELAGKGGNIELTAEEIFLRGGAFIDTSTYGPGEGGRIKIQATKTMRMEGESSQGRTSYITAATGGQTELAGKGGNIELSTEKMLISDGATIAAATIGPGKGGNIKLRIKDSLSIIGKDGEEDSGGISAESESRSANAGKSGDIEISAERITLAKGGWINTGTQAADGGNIIITTPGYLYIRNNSAVASRVKALAGNGGNIIVKPGFIILDSGRINANAAAGNGGNISISTHGIYSFSDLQPEQAAQKFITASSEKGIAGEKNITSPEIDISSGLVTLPVSLIDPGKLQQTPCDTRDAEHISRFLVSRSPGTPALPEDMQAGYVFAGRARDLPETLALAVMRNSECDGNIF
ncbi:MAG: filamentous hemagglutinin N-terminal domain-containing protein [Gammaproteobacteria bacterium]|nr:filamentous hemagglutinin N-terminal domain-containing protein [Gammaproteobacteria bacterium]